MAGQCYSCGNQGVSELMHPSGGGYMKGHEGSGSHCGYADSSDDECGMWHIYFYFVSMFSSYWALEYGKMQKMPLKCVIWIGIYSCLNNP